MKTAGFDWLFIDLEHGSLTLDTACQIAVGALDAGLAPIVRVPNGEYSMATRALDNGALGIVIPHVDSAEEAREVVAKLKYPPDGHRSGAGGVPQFDYRSVKIGELTKSLNAATLISVMLETPRAIGNAKEIAAEPGIDVLLIGTNDLCAEMGIPGHFAHERRVDAYERTVATIELINPHPQGNPQGGQSQTLRLIQQEKVAAVLGAYHSSVALAATAVAERYGMPFLVSDSVALNITQRGFKWIFRTGPIAPDFANAYTAFLPGLKQGGRTIERIAIVNENTDYGTSVAASILEAARKTGINVAAQIPYNANSSDVSGQVLQLKDLKPDAVIFISYTADTILYFKTLKNLDYLPPMIIGEDAGFSDPTFIPTVGELAQGAMNRSAFDIGKPGSHSYKINTLFKAKRSEEHTSELQSHSF